MIRIDTDLMSTQEARILIENAREGQKILSTYTQERIDKIVEGMAKDVALHAEELAKLAVEETGFGVVRDKCVKNQFASEFLYSYIKDMKTIGIINEDPVAKTMDVGVPVGVIVALLPSTNPTSTAICTTLIAIKSGNAVVFSPHPKAKNSIIKTLDILIESAKRNGAPEDIISYLTVLSPQGTKALMSHKDTSLIISNTARQMADIAHYAGKPTINGGPSNGPAFIERSADVKQAIHEIVSSKTFDNGLLCSSEQSIVAEECIVDQVKEELKHNGAYFMTQAESDMLSPLFYTVDGRHNPAIVGRTAYEIAQKAGFTVPKETTVLISEQQYVSETNPYCREKLCPVLAFFVEKNWMFACEKCIELLITEGKGHTLVIHSQDEAVIREFALKKPVSRMLVNTSGALGGIGLTTHLPPALILSTGSVGGGFTSDNISPMNLINIRKVGYGVRQIEEALANPDLCRPIQANKAAHTNAVDHSYEGQGSVAQPSTAPAVEQPKRCKLGHSLLDGQDYNLEDALQVLLKNLQS
ncbi:acetaldehyde dehydrogenase (acetylating) [uncultured Veillonella sp.]|uniref:acetaldehyde dehydrogenase (acetylating) n=1 Tax=uncultured Veillonella sp. TaxID=159268 RepID=UPI00261DD5F7|nr:acetaldehyde dehydrogenase (acetylating) [uncultured Veillonella sp.]